LQEDALIAATIVLALGTAAQWLAWRITLPSIIFLLMFGFAAGPITGVLDVEAILGDLLFPFVSISVAIILFEGGMTLRIQDVLGVRGPLRGLLTIGVLTTWTLATLAARFIIGIDWSLSLLVGAILIVTGPTVVIPHIEPYTANRPGTHHFALGGHQH
jgi:NhaP-type Na+/H+ or K+/H+ antiporter